ncbi:MAG: hypothetical protein ABSD78_11840 [Acidimicrobiales bacterium]
MRRHLAGRAVAAGLVVVACLLAGCGYSGTPDQKVQEWAKQSSFVSDNDTLVDDIVRVHRAVKIGTAEQLRTICGGFAYDVGTAYDTLPTPDQALTNDLNQADTAFLAAATTCGDVSSVTSPAMKGVVRNINSGLGALERAQRLLQSLGLSWKVHL